MVKVILFDADGVVIAATEQFGDYFGRKHTISLERMKPFYSGVFLECVKGKVDLKKVILPYLHDWGYMGSVDTFLDEWFTFEHKINKHIIDSIKRFQTVGIGCYLATNQEKYRSQYLLDQMGFKDIFDGFFFSSSIGHLKQSAEFFQFVLQKMVPILPEEILFWDDDIDKLEAAKKVGIQVEQYFSYEDFQKKMNIYLAFE